VEEVADDADFFAEGGDSIKAVQLSSWLQQKGIKLDLGKIFYTPVFSDMAETLEETEPMYVPDELMTKELINEKVNDIVQKGEGAQATPKAVAAQADGQACDPNQMPAAKPQADGQVCDPNQMPAAKPQADGQVCDPAPMPARNSDYDMMISMFQTMLSQQQVMLQMMQVMLSQRSQAPQFIAPMQGGGAPFRAPFRPQAPIAAPRFPVQAAPTANRAQNMDNVSPEVRAQLAQQMQKYQSHPVDKPIDKPNVIGLKPAKVAKAEHSAEEVLDHVLSGLLGDGYSRTEDFFEQGLTSFDVVKMVTRCGEHGYALSMQDVYMHSNFDELLGYMKPGE
jgi:aryl carrier-like protein